MLLVPNRGFKEKQSLILKLNSKVSRNVIAVALTFRITQKSTWRVEDKTPIWVFQRHNQPSQNSDLDRRDLISALSSTALFTALMFAALKSIRQGNVSKIYVKLL